MEALKIFVHISLCVLLIQPAYTKLTLWEKLFGKIRDLVVQRNFNGQLLTKSKCFVIHDTPIESSTDCSTFAAKMGESGQLDEAIDVILKYVKGSKVWKKEIDLYEKFHNVNGFPTYFGNGRGNADITTLERFIVLEKFEMTLEEFMKKKFSNENDKKLFALEFLIVSFPILRSLHKEGIIHRDINPKNFLVRIDPSGFIYLALRDFSSAQRQADCPVEPIGIPLYSSIFNQPDDTETRQGHFSCEKDDYESLLYTFYGLIDAKDWEERVSDFDSLLLMKKNLVEKIKSKFGTETEIFEILESLVKDTQNHKRQPMWQKHELTFQHKFHLDKLNYALQLLQNNYKSKSNFIGKLQANRPIFTTVLN